MVKTLTTSCTPVFRALYLTRKKCRSHEEQLKSAVFPVPKSFSPVAGMLLMWHFLLSCCRARNRAQGFAQRSRNGANSSPRGLSSSTAEQRQVGNGPWDRSGGHSHSLPVAGWKTDLLPSSLCQSLFFSITSVIIQCKISSLLKSHATTSKSAQLRGFGTRLVCKTMHRNNNQIALRPGTFPSRSPKNTLSFYTRLT